MTKRIDNQDQGNDPFGPFNLSDFKKWMKSQPEENRSSRQDMLGLHVESKVSPRKLLARMEVQDGEAEEVAKEFCKEGGVISDLDGHNVLIEVDSGSFVIHRMYVKRRD